MKRVARKTISAMMVLTLVFTIIVPLIVPIGFKAGAQDFTTTQVTLNSNYDFIGQYVNGQAFAVKGSNVGLLDESGNFTQLPGIYSFDSVSEDATAGMSIKVNFLNLTKNGVTTKLSTSGATYDGADVFWDSSNSVQLVPVERLVNGVAKWGYASPDGTIKIDCQYDNAEAFKDGIARVTNGVYPNRLYGYIDENGKTILPVKYIDSSIQNGYISVWDYDTNGNWIENLFNEDGTPVFPVGSYLSIRPNSDCILFAVEDIPEPGYKFGKWGVVDKNNNKVIGSNYWSLSFGYGDDSGLITALNSSGNYSFIKTDGTPAYSGSIDLPYESASTFSNGYAAVEDKTTSKWGAVDTTGKLVVQCLYDWQFMFDNDGLAVVSYGGKYGEINTTGKSVVDCQYYNRFSFMEGVAFVANKDGKYGVIDQTGTMITDFLYDIPFGFSDPLSFYHGLAVVVQNGKFGLIDKTGKSVVDCQYKDFISYSNGLTAFENISGKWVVVDTTGKTINLFVYDKAPFGFFNGLSIVEKGGLYGLIDETGTEIIHCDYDSLQTLDYKVYTASQNSDMVPTAMNADTPHAVPLARSTKTLRAVPLALSAKTARVTPLAVHVEPTYSVFKVAVASAALATAPSITLQPQSLTVVGNQNAALSVTATGTGPLSYQWYKDGNAISGATSSTFTITGAQSADAGSYAVKVSNTAATVTSDAAIVKVDWGNPDTAAVKQITGVSTGTGFTADVPSSAVNGIGSGNVSVTLGNATLSIPASIISGLTADDPTGSLRFTEQPSSPGTVSSITNLLSAQNSFVASFDLDLTKLFPDGTSAAVHQLGGNIKITLALNDAQISNITDASTAKLYYLNTATNALEQVDAAFDLTAKTVTFYTDHFSTYVVANGTVPNPDTGGNNMPLFPLAFVGAGSACSIFILRRHSKQIKKSDAK